jgi:hypothetical protein
MRWRVGYRTGRISRWALPAVPHGVPAQGQAVDLQLQVNWRFDLIFDSLLIIPL